MITIATRTYPIDDIRTGIEYTARDILMRDDAGQFFLNRTTNGHPGEPDSLSEFSIKGAFEWLRDIPEQIERAVY